MCDRGVSILFPINSGVRQGSVLAPMFLTVVFTSEVSVGHWVKLRSSD